MDKIKVFCAGKINLTLNILGKDPKTGLHYIDSIMQSVDVGDYVTVKKSPYNNVNIGFKAGKSSLISQKEVSLIGRNNSVLKAVDALKRQFGDFGADICVEKNLPLCGGLGGSSADAAAVLIALDALFNFSQNGLNLTEISKQIGSDVAFMLSGGCARVSGTGGTITPLNSLLRLYTAIARPKGQKKACSSGKIYRVFDSLAPSFTLKLSDNQKVIDALNKGEISAAKMFDNALTPAAETHAGGIKSLCKELLSLNATAAVMSGSGNCVTGFFEDKETANKATLTLQEKHFRAEVCKFLEKGTEIL